MKQMYFTKVLTFFLTLIASCTIFAQDAILTGTISDAKETLVDAGVTTDVGGSKRGTVTDIDGKYTLKLPAGTYKVSYSYTGYETQSLTITLAAGETKQQDIVLGESANVLETVVVTATKFEQKLGEQTVSLEVVRPSLVDRVNNTAVDQTIKKVPGVTVVDGQANIRGGSGYSYGAGSRVMLLMDDLPILTPDAGFPRWSFLPIENLEQVEVIKGASSALYGSSALNGIINLRTAYPKSTPVTKISMFSGIYQNPRNNEYYVYNKTTGAIKDTLQKAWWGNEQPHEEGFSFAHRQKFGQLDVVTGGYFFNQKTWRQGDFDRRGRMNLNLRYRFASVPGLSVGINTNVQKTKSGSFLIWNNLNDLGENDSVVGGIDKGAYQLWTATPPIENRRWTYSIDPFAEYWNEASQIRHKLLTRYYKNDNKTNTNQSTNSDLLYGEYQFQKRWNNNLVLTAGAVATLGKSDSELFGEYVNSSGDTINIIRKSTNIGAYVQADKKFFDKLNISLGARYEINNIDSGVDTIDIQAQAKPVVRLGINYQLADYTFLRASFGQGYRFPTIAEKFVTTNLGAVAYQAGPITLSVPVGIFPNESLQSETGWSAELGIKQGIKISNWKGFVDVAGYVNQYNDMMEFTFGAGSSLVPILPFVWKELKHLYDSLGTAPTKIPSGGIGFQSINIGNTRIIGSDISFVGQGNIGKLPTTVLAGYTYIVPKFRTFDYTQQVLSSASYDEDGTFNPDTKTDNVLKYRSSHVIKVDIESTYKKVALGVSWQYSSYMKAIDQAFNIFLPGIDAYRKATNGQGISILDARLTYNMAKNASMTFVVNNLLNGEYATRPALVDAPRNFTIRLNYNFDYEKEQ